MNISERIKKFNRENQPFDIIAHGGKYWLSLQCVFLSGKYENYKQDIFKKHDDEYRSYGSGYDWECVFKRAFRNEPRLREIDFDSEAGRFYCYADDLSLLESLGSRFRKLCYNNVRFEIVVDRALRECEQMTVEELLRDWGGKYEITTPDGIVCVSLDEQKPLLEMIKTTVVADRDKKETKIDVYDFLNQRVKEYEYNGKKKINYAETVYPDKEELMLDINQ